MQKLVAYFRQRFTRVTSSVAYIPQLDGLRALALLLVIGHHIFTSYLLHTHRLGVQEIPRDWFMAYQQAPFVNWALNMSFGVQIFFAISGFVLALPFARAIFDCEKFPSVRQYLLRRLIRLEPPYIVAITICMLPRLPLLHPVSIFWQLWHPFGAHYLASITYLHALIYREPSWFSGVSWTLEIEIQFYLVMPLLALVFYLRNNIVRRLLLAVATFGAEFFTNRYVYHLQELRWRWSLPGHLGFFLAGILLADLYLDPPCWLRLKTYAGDVLALVSVGVGTYILHHRTDLYPWLPFLVIAFFFGLFKNGLLGRIFSSTPMTSMGLMCYTIYLYHYLILDLCMGWTAHWFAPVHWIGFDMAVQYVLLLPVILLLSGLMYLAVERRFVILSHTLTKRWSTAPAAGPDNTSGNAADAVRAKLSC